MSDYSTYAWIEQRHLTASLIAMSDAELAQHQANCVQIDEYNTAMWETAEVERRRALADYRSQHPRGSASYQLTTANPSPPTLRTTFKALMERRASGIRAQARQAEAEKGAFLDRMSEGKVNAMRRRYQRAEASVVAVGIEMGIQFKSRYLDERLIELFELWGCNVEGEANRE